MRKGPDLKRSELSSPHSLMVSVLSTDIRENTGVQPTGVLVRFFETYITSTDHFNNLTSQTLNQSGKGISNVAALSIDAIFSPYCTYFGYSGDFPSFTLPTDSSLDASALYLNPFNPMNTFGTGVPGSGFGRAWMDSGHNIAFAMGGSGIGNPSGVSPSGSGLGYNVNPHSMVFDIDYEVRGKVETNNIRAVGLRAPMVLTGWGFDVNGTPTQTSNFADPRQWKTGPVDLRWDEDRGVWAGGTQTKIYLVKTTNSYNPACFSYEVDRAVSRAQYTRNALDPRQYSTATGTLPSGIHSFPETGIYDPEYVAYSADARNSGCFEALNYTDGEYPYYEAFIIRETNLDPVQTSLYNIWTEDCHDCGHVANPCNAGTNHGSVATNKKILIENPLRQNFDVGDLAFTVKTGRKKQVYSGGFIGGSGVGASGRFTTNASGILSFSILSGGSGYSAGAFPVYNQPCVGLSLTDSSGVITGGTITGTTTGYLANQVYNVSFIPKNATSATEELDIHWCLKLESKTQQIITHVEASNGVLQTCTMKIQTEGYKSCEHCGEASSLINSFL